MPACWPFFYIYIYIHIYIYVYIYMLYICTVDYTDMTTCKWSYCKFVWDKKRLSSRCMTFISVSEFIWSVMCANTRVNYNIITVWRSYSLLYALQDLIIIILQIYLQALDTWKAYQVYSVELMSKNKSVLSVISHAKYRVVRFTLTHSSYHHQIQSMNT